MRGTLTERVDANGTVRVMVTLDEVDQMAMALGEVTVGERYGNRAWSVRGKVFVWERAFSKADIKRFGEATPPSGPIIAVLVDDLADKEAVLQANAKGVFTIAHFDSYPAVLIQLDIAARRAVRELVLDAWLSCAPDDLAARHLR